MIGVVCLAGCARKPISGRGAAFAATLTEHVVRSWSITNDPGHNNGAETYMYDNVGNRKTLASTIPSLPGSVSYNYDANDRLSIDTYDNNGDTISSGGVASTYDFENHMLTHGAVTMVYDGDGNRVSETAGGVTTKFLIDSLNPTGFSQVLDELVSGAVTRTYTYGRQLISENQLISGTWTPSFYGYDGHGNVRFLANSSGTVGNTYQFDAFGAQIASTGTTPNNYLYSGEWLDPNLSLYNLRARYYNALTGRFDTMDRVLGNVFDPATLHKYVYTRNNPVNRIDPSGNADIEEYDTVTFSRVENGLTHGYNNHFACSLLGEEAIIAAITQAVLQVAGSGAQLGGTFEGLVEVDFQQIIYRAFPRAGTGCINVSTFFPPPLE